MVGPRIQDKPRRRQAMDQHMSGEGGGGGGTQAGSERGSLPSARDQEAAAPNNGRKRTPVAHSEEREGERRFL